jgi:predicted RNA binding protein YcfA (HicA-like mRNA interferase family)
MLDIRINYVLLYQLIKEVDELKTSELIRKLRKAGCTLVNHKTRHDEWFSPITQRGFMVPRHGGKEIANGTAISILKDAGII